MDMYETIEHTLSFSSIEYMNLDELIITRWRILFNMVEEFDSPPLWAYYALKSYVDLEMSLFKAQFIYLTERLKNEDTSIENNVKLQDLLSARFQCIWIRRRTQYEQTKHDNMTTKFFMWESKINQELWEIDKEILQILNKHKEVEEFGNNMERLEVWCE